MIIDLTYLRNLTGEDQTLLKEIYDIFVEQIEEYNIKFSELLLNSDYDQLSKVAHKATSTLAIVGMEKESKMLKELEIKAKDRIEVDSYENIINTFELHSKKAIEEFKDSLSNT